MEIGIDAYRAAAAANIGQLAIVDDGPDAKTVGSAGRSGVGFLKRLFNTEASRKVNAEVVADFKRAMVRAYGERIAQAAFDSEIGARAFSGEKLSSSRVRRTLDLAESLRAKRLAPPPDARGISLCIGGKTADISFQGLSPAYRDALFGAASALANLDDLLMELPTDPVAFADFSRRIEDARAAAKSALEMGLHNLRVDGGPAAERAGLLAGALERSLALVDGKIEEARATSAANPLTYKALGDFAALHVDAAADALAALEGGLEAFALGDAARGAMGAIRDAFLAPDGIFALLKDAASARPEKLGAVADPALKAELERLFPPRGDVRPEDVCPDPEKRIGKGFGKTVAKFCAAEIDRRLRAHVPPIRHGFDASAFVEAFRKAQTAKFSDRINAGEWKTIDKSVTFATGGIAGKGRSVITPASKLDGPVGESYAGGPNGVNCHCYAETRHAANLAASKFEIEVGGKTTVAFAGVRHAVHAAMDVTDRKTFRQASLNRATEAVVAAFTSRPDLLQKALANPGEPVKFAFTSVSLLTPDFVRGDFKIKGPHGNEKAMLEAQNRAYEKLNGAVIDVPVTDPATGRKTVVKIRPVVATFNYGVNSFSVGSVSTFLGGWGAAQKVNYKGLIRLNKFAEVRLAAMERELAATQDAALRAERERKLAAARTLLRQINALDRTAGYAGGGRDPYKMASRIAVLTYLFGGTPAWNCKSGKDRTGLMDAECKFLATLVALGRPIPEPGRDLDPDEKLLYRNILLGSGNHELQKYNAGIAGYMLENAPELPKRIGDNLAYRVFIGGSRLASK